ncbi:PD-(D/E)XK nuclease family protein [Enterococcus dongliensis]|uniref:PD-(D/E)XK nuclease family protein n=1 Tax=Enterococcus dongliensis TaxID=2559925 RepID=UPI002890C7CB|nr:PD-(D/E)XK nuclease family protein [Enterococcus dongliensis]MDT2602661.1 PD-(D/E)XK nuclease family protein [Enterococcus dongliensis]MDT2643846.1 PD-(D/E)XK nuclease family protein [Enterococcus dongliensis]MDT2670635.1 PD-(D/E)XK nuclease family protein [Enterococcus dongliensis]
MTLQFLLGAGQNDATEQMIQTAQAWLEKNPENRVFFLVPNYNKFEQEITLLSAMKQIEKKTAFSTIRTQVFSFQRLAWYFLQRDGQVPGNILSEAGNAMILRKILQELKEDLTIFRGEVNKTGFIQQLVGFYQEMQIGNVTVADLVENGSDPDQVLKLQDLQKVFTAYEEALIDYQVVNEDPLLLLHDYLQGQDLAHSLFIVSGFTRFNARELNVLNALMTCGELIVSLELDRPYPSEEPNPLNLFADPGKTYFQLKKNADFQQIQVRPDRFARKKATVFNQVGAFWADQERTDLSHSEQIQLTKYGTVAEEIRKVGEEIRRLVREEGYRYKDIQILLRNPKIYDSVLPDLFQKLAIPFYLDETQAMAAHPLIEFLQALFLIDNYHYRINDVFRLLRTELFAPFNWAGETWFFQQQEYREKIDQTENVCLAYNFRGSAWTKKSEWAFVDYDFEADVFNDAKQLEAIANEVRRSIQQVLPPFFEKIKQAANGLEAATTFYHFLENSGVKKQLLFWRDQEVERGNLDKARNHEQTWQALLDLLDEYVLIYGADPFDWTAFQEIFLAGLMNLSYGKIPTAIDQVRINDLELARVDQMKVTFAIGLNNNEFPARFDDKGLLSAEERSLFNQNLPDGKFLPESNSSKVNREPFLAYSVFLSATEKLYLSVAATVEGEKKLEISAFLRRLSQGLQLPIKESESLKLTSAPEDHIGTMRTLLSDLIALNRFAQDENRAFLPSWRELQKFIQNSSLAPMAQRVFKSLQDLNIPKELLPETAEQLYGKNLYVSVSRIENFYNCQYKYFANFGLGLKERTVYGLTPAAAGDFYHEALDQFFRLIKEQGLRLAELNEAERNHLAEEVLKEIFGELKFAILSSSARMNYIRYQLSRTIQRVSWALVQQGMRTSFEPQQTEILFGSIGGKKGIPGIDLPLSNGGKVAVRGKIDRLDQLQGNEHDWLSVIDYKSSPHSFNVADAYYGIALQLITYLDVAVTDFSQANGKEVKPAGAYYLHVHNPVLQEPKNVEKDMLKAYQYDGLFAKEPALYEELDRSLQEKENSVLFPIKKDKNGQTVILSQSKDKFYDLSEIELLREYNREKIQQAGNQIISGEIKLNPTYKDNQRIACQYCPFRSVCKFDAMLKENNYHRLEKLSKEEVLKRMGEELHDN